MRNRVARQIQPYQHNFFSQLFLISILMKSAGSDKNNIQTFVLTVKQNQNINKI